MDHYEARLGEHGIKPPHTPRPIRGTPEKQARNDRNS
jgi:hypothetical protein